MKKKFRKLVSRAVRGLLLQARQRGLLRPPPVLSPESREAGEAIPPAAATGLRLRPRDLGNLVLEHLEGGGPITGTRSWPFPKDASLIPHPHDWPQLIVPLPKLDFGRHALESRIIRELEPHVSWRQTEYAAFPPLAVMMREVIVHGAAGLVGIGGNDVAETLWHTLPDLDNYRHDEGMIVIPDHKIERLSGKTISLLGGAGNYFHALIDGVARLALIPQDVIAQTDRILLPENGVGQAAIIALYRLPARIEVRCVAPHDTFLVDDLVFPWSVHGVFSFHPCVNTFFDRVLAGMPPGAAPGPERLYVDRRGAGLRRLVNEEAVAAALEGLGFVSVRLEALSQEAQVALFRDARIIVSPHGAGLTNLAFATPGCAVIELVMDAYLNWGYRKLAAVRGLRYDCVVGRAFEPWGELTPAFHSQRWEIEVPEVLRAVGAVIEAGPQPDG